MAEQYTFTAAIDPPQTVFRVAVIAFDWFNSRIDVQLRAWDGTAFVGDRIVRSEYTGTVAMGLMVALNKANLTTQSLHQRILARLLADGKIAGGTGGGVVD